MARMKVAPELLRASNQPRVVLAIMRRSSFPGCVGKWLEPDTICRISTSSLSSRLPTTAEEGSQVSCRSVARVSRQLHAPTHPTRAHTTHAAAALSHLSEQRTHCNMGQVSTTSAKTGETAITMSTNGQ
jgi:hypothetical protein